MRLDRTYHEHCQGGACGMGAGCDKISAIRSWYGKALKRTLNWDMVALLTLPVSPLRLENTAKYLKRILGVFVYQSVQCLAFWQVVSMSFSQRLFSSPDHALGAQKSGHVGAPNVSLRQRNFSNLASAKSGIRAPEKEAPQESLPLQVKKKPSAPKKPKPAMPTVMESISVVLRRQVPIRFDEAPRSWIGGLPKLPVGMEWPQAKPKKPLHFIAQINCADLPPELWGGLGPRDGWLLLFADMEALTEQENRPLARVFHVTELGPDAEPPSRLYWARNNLGDVSKLKGTLPGVQRRHFRQWPVDLVSVAADTSELTGSELYGAPENDIYLFASGGFAIKRPMTWRGAYTILAGLVRAHSADRMADSTYFLVDYPEPDADDFNKEWWERRDQLPEFLQGGYGTYEFSQADKRLRAQMYQERRKGWTRRALKVLDEQMTIDLGRLADHRAKAADAARRGDEAANVHNSSVMYFENMVAQHEENRAYLEDLFAQYPSEEALTSEINRVGLAHREWGLLAQDKLRELLDQAGKMDLDAPIAPDDWEDITAQVADMKSVCWTRAAGTAVLRKVEHRIHYEVKNTCLEEVLDCYASPPSSAEGLDPAIITDLESRLRHFETEKPHKMGGMIDSVYQDPLKKGHILLFQIASDAATGWIMGDLGLLYVSVDASDLKAGSFENARAWLEA